MQSLAILWHYFHKGKRQNTAHFHTYCTSNLSVKQTDRRNRLSLPKLQKMTKVTHSLHAITYRLMAVQIGSSIHSEHQLLGLLSHHSKWTNHKPSVNLLTVPHYSNLLEDMDAEDKSDCGQALVNNDAGWRTEMAKWIGDACTAEAAKEDSDSDDNTLAPNAWIPTTPS